LTPGNLEWLSGLAACGVVGFKAFMIESGMDDFPAIDADSLREGMRIAAGLGLPVAVHAEDAGIIAGRTAAIRASGRHDAAAFLASRPVESELAAVRVALDLAGETGCALHVVHVSCAEAAGLAAVARAAGVDVTVEACPHHLLLNDTAMARHGAHAKCAPPLREETIRAGLWAAVLDGRVDSIGSDHSPAPPEMKTGDDLFAAWGGIMGCQHGFLLLLDRVLAEAPGRLPAVWRMLSENPARRLGLADRKGAIAPGLDADLILVDPGAAREITASELLTRHQTSPYIGRSVRARVVHTFRRGELLDLRSTGGGKFLPASRG
jgi:allantoinase